MATEVAVPSRIPGEEESCLEGEYLSRINTRVEVGCSISALLGVANGYRLCCSKLSFLSKLALRGYHLTSFSY
jgi:hypothetical protein